MAGYDHRYWAFISYSSHDRVLAHWLQRTLEAFVVPHALVGRTTPAGDAPKRFRPIFRDRTDLPADADLRARLLNELSQSAYLLVICSPHSARSHWVNDEIIGFRAQHGSTRIFSVIVGGDLVGEQTCFPPALRGDASASGASCEPIAADLRPGGDGKRVTLLKLAAGMLGVGLDEIIRRDRQRRHRLWVFATAASMAGMAVMSALATAAYVARNDAQRQRSHAEGLIEFMLTDLRKALEPSGRLDAMDGVGREALKYYGAQRPRDLDQQGLARQARALRLMGEIRVQRGDLSAALAAFEQAAAATAELLTRSPEDGSTILNHAQNVFWVGEIARQRGDTVSAESQFQEYRRLAERLTAKDPSNDDWTAEVGYAESALGALYLEKARPAEAVSAFQRSLAVDQDLADRHPTESTAQINLAQAHAWLAEALLKQGRLMEARSHRETELRIYQAVLASDATVRQAKFSMVIALQNLGQLILLTGDPQSAAAHFSDAVAKGEALLLTERDNMDLAAVVAYAQIELGETELVMGQQNLARTAHQRADTLLNMSLTHDATVELWLYYQHRATQLAAAVAASDHNFERALQIDQALLQSLLAGGTATLNTDSFWLLQRSRLQTGDDLAALGRGADARREWNFILSSVSESAPDLEPKLLPILAAADTRLGRASEAATINHRLKMLSN